MKNLIFIVLLFIFFPSFLSGISLFFLANFQAICVSIAAGTNLSSAPLDSIQLAVEQY